MIRILVCDDNEWWMNENKRSIEDIMSKLRLENVIYCYTQAKNIQEELLEEIDIAVLDIELIETTGIELAERINSVNKNASVIFITGFDTFTKEAYSVCAAGYLTKPIKKEVLEILIERAITYKEGIDVKKATLQFYDARKLTTVRQRNIMAIERVGRKVVIETTQKEYSIIKSLSEVEQELEDFFLKINQGTVLNMYEISMIENMYAYTTFGKKYKISKGFIKEAESKLFKFQQK